MKVNRRLSLLWLKMGDSLNARNRDPTCLVCSSELMLFSDVGCCPLIGHNLRVKYPLSTEVRIQPISSFSTCLSVQMDIFNIVFEISYSCLCVIRIF